MISQHHVTKHVDFWSGCYGTKTMVVWDDKRPPSRVEILSDFSVLKDGGGERVRGGKGGLGAGDVPHL